MKNPPLIGVGVGENISVVGCLHWRLSFYVKKNSCE